MRPVYVSNKMKYKINKKKLTQAKSKFCGRPGILTSDFDNINQILHLRVSKGKESWKVMPKDSCEVYRERRQRNRQLTKKESSKYSNKTEKKITKRPLRRARQNYKAGQRRRKRKQLASCSCCSSLTSCTCSTETKSI